MPEADGFRINTPLVAIQEIEGEAILINFDTGCYYGANVTGSVLLELAQRGESVAAMVRALAGRCGVADSEVAGAADSFFKAAIDGGLLVPLDSSLVGSAPEAGASAPRRAGIRGAGRGGRRAHCLRRESERCSPARW